MSELTKITTPAAGFLHQANDLLAEKCRVFIAKGRFAADDVPDTKAELAALYSGSTPKFIPFGDMDESGSKINWTPKKKTIDFSVIAMSYDVKSILVNVTITKDMLTFVDALNNEDYSLLFVPDGNDSTFFALSGVTISHEGELPIIDGDNVGKITFELFKNTKKITNVVKLDVMAS